MDNIGNILREGKSTTAEALTIFDTLEVIDTAFMMGKWCGSGIYTQHPMDGLLETFDWYGKEFIDLDNVHPLIFQGRNRQLFNVDPRRLPVRLVANWTMPQNKMTRFLFHSARFLLKTSKTKARLRMIEFRGKASAAMVYDNFPIIDSFRKIDENTVFGVMDYKAMEKPFFFILKRD